MLPHQERVVAEKDELADKCKKLDDFLFSKMFSTLDREEQERLREQLMYMTKYLGVLDRRINAFN
jgi:hypothetical protein